MRIGGIYSHKNGKEAIKVKYAIELGEIVEIINKVDVVPFKTKVGKEKTTPKRLLYKPGGLNKAYMHAFAERGWQNYRVQYDYPTEFYANDYSPLKNTKGTIREMDFIKNSLGVSIQFSKNAALVYSSCAKMTIFHNEGVIDVGVEIVPLKELANEMSSGVSYFEQFVWDLEHRGTADIDIPVLILGVTI